MPPPLTAAQLRAEALRARAEGEALIQYADELARLADRAPLTIERKRSMVGSNMEASSLAGKPENVRTSANRARRPSAARDAMIAGNHVAADLANALKVGRSTVNAWLNGTRSIPPEHKAKLAKAPWNIPPAAWLKSA